MIWAATRWRGHSSGPTGSHKSPYCCCCFVDGLQLWIIFVASSCQNWWQLQCALRWNIFHPENFNIWTLLPSSGFFLLWGHLTPESRCRSESSKTLLGKAEEDLYNAARSFSPWTGLFWPPACLSACLDIYLDILLADAQRCPLGWSGTLPHTILVGWCIVQHCPTLSNIVRYCPTLSDIPIRHILLTGDKELTHRCIKLHLFAISSTSTNVLIETRVQRSVHQSFYPPSKWRRQLGLKPILYHKWSSCLILGSDAF